MKVFEVLTKVIRGLKLVREKEMRRKARVGDTAEFETGV